MQFQTAGQGLAKRTQYMCLVQGEAVIIVVIVVFVLVVLLLWWNILLIVRGWVS